MIHRGDAGRRVRLAGVSACLFLLAATASNFVASQASGLASLWAANGVVFGLLVAVSRSRDDARAIVIGAVVGNIASAILRHQDPAVVPFFVAANMIEAIGAAVMLRWMGGVSGAFDRVRDVFALVVASLIAPVPSGLIGALALHVTAGVPILQTWFSWYNAAALSLAIVAPAIIVLARFSESLATYTMPARRVGEVIAILGLVAIMSLLVFYGTRLPILFILLPFVLLATFRLRQFGAVAAIIIVAAIAARATMAGHGPIAAHSLGGASQLLMLQFYLAVTFLTSLPVAAALVQSDQRAEEAHMLADHFKSVVENVDEVIFRTDRKGRWTYLNPAWERISGYGVAASLGRSWLDGVEESERDAFGVWAQPVLDGDVPATRRMLRFRTGRGELRWMEISIQSLFDTHGHAMGTTGTLRDIEERKRMEDHVMSAKRRAEEQAREATLLASTDELTGLANRRAFLRHLERQVEAANEFGWDLAVAIFDVDHFKLVNDKHGHAMGDRVLQLVSARAVSVVRSGDLVGRLGGEEFAILMPGASPEDAALVAERLRMMIERPGDGQLAGAGLPVVTVSIGIAAHHKAQDAAALLAGADRALYAAKSSGRNRVKMAA